MKLRRKNFSRAITLVTMTVIVVTTSSVARGVDTRVKHHRYKVVDVGTLGGPNGDVLVPPPAAQIFTNNSIFVGSGETNLPDPFQSACFNPDCLVEQLLLWIAGTRVHLSSLRRGYSGLPVAVNNSGVAVDDGLIFGGALNTIPDSDSADPFFVPVATQVHAVLRKLGKIQDLGTLGGADSVVYQANNSGQAVGISFTDAVRHESAGLPTTHPFLWDRGHMYDVGSLGGTKSIGYGLDNRGEIVGFSRLAGDTAKHPFLWRHGKLNDLGTLGGDNGEAWSINDFGYVFGRTDVPGSQSHHAFLWRDHQMKDLGTPDGNACSTKEMVNRFDQVVGESGECFVGGDLFLWENDDIVAIRDLIVPGSGRFVFDAFDINDQGEIVSLCATPEGHVHVCLLMPIGEPTSDFAPLDSQAHSLMIPTERYPTTGEKRISMPGRSRTSQRSAQTFGTVSGR